MRAKFYEKAVKPYLNPVLEVYARLNAIRQQKGDDKIIRKTSKELVRMARKDRYVAHRDIIYYAAAEMELERNNIAGAQSAAVKATVARPAKIPRFAPKRFYCWAICVSGRKLPRCQTVLRDSMITVEKARYR